MLKRLIRPMPQKSWNDWKKLVTPIPAKIIANRMTNTILVMKTGGRILLRYVRLIHNDKYWYCDEDKDGFVLWLSSNTEKLYDEIKKKSWARLRWSKRGGSGVYYAISIDELEQVIEQELRRILTWIRKPFLLSARWKRQRGTAKYINRLNEILMWLESLRYRPGNS